MCYPCHRTLPQLPQFSILMNLYFVYVINIRFICDGAIYLLTSAKKIYKEQLILKSSIQWYHMTESDVIKNRYSQVFYVVSVLKSTLSETNLQADIIKDNV